MSFEIEATYENGVLKPDRPLPFGERERVVVSITRNTDPVADCYGCIPAPIDLDALDYLTNSPENSPDNKPWT